MIRLCAYKDEGCRLGDRIVDQASAAAADQL